MRILKTTGILLLSLLSALFILFYVYTSFVDHLDVPNPEKTDFMHPSKLLMKYEVFISGILMRPSYCNFVRDLKLTGNEKILDFGSGAGGEAVHLAKLIRNKNGRLTCLDISPSWLQVVRYRLSGYNNIDFIEGDITEQKLPGNTFDTIVVRLVLHDIPKDRRRPIINNFHAVLKPGGSVYIYEPVTGGHAIDETEMRSHFTGAGFTERYFNRVFSFVMVPPCTMAMAAYDKKPAPCQSNISTAPGSTSP
ncbi:MAG TPA: class I SAM-dependent methyltransferase [Spirochaetota bacterium]|nr:class I SAM-dependent methyltransferase [Spirochaetota bacterium]